MSDAPAVPRLPQGPLHPLMGIGSATMGVHSSDSSTGNFKQELLPGQASPGEDRILLRRRLAEPSRLHLPFLPRNREQGELSGHPARGPLTRLVAPSWTRWVSLGSLAAPLAPLSCSRFGIWFGAWTSDRFRLFQVPAAQPGLDLPGGCRPLVLGPQERLLVARRLRGGPWKELHPPALPRGCPRSPRRAQADVP